MLNMKHKTEAGCEEQHQFQSKGAHNTAKGHPAKESKAGLGCLRDQQKKKKRFQSLGAVSGREGRRSTVK